MRRALAGIGACAALVAGGLLPASQASAAAPTSQPVPIITPTPQRIEAVNRAAHLPGTVRVQTTSNTDPAARAALVAILESHAGPPCACISVSAVATRWLASTPADVARCLSASRGI